MDRMVFGMTIKENGNGYIYVMNNRTKKLKKITVKKEYFQNGYHTWCSQIDCDISKGYIKKGIPEMEYLAIVDDCYIDEDYFIGTNKCFELHNSYESSGVRGVFIRGIETVSVDTIMSTLEHGNTLPEAYPEHVWMYLKTHHADWIENKLPVEKRLMLV